VKEFGTMTHNRIAEFIVAPADVDPVEGVGVPHEQDVVNPDAPLLDAYSQAVTPRRRLPSRRRS
jgi:hypothetical protein